MTSNAIVLTLPPELDALIATALGDDLESLHSFCLASRSWLSVGQPILFRRVKLHFAFEETKLLEILNNSPHIGSYIKHLRVSNHISLSENFMARLTDLQDLDFFVSKYKECNIFDYPYIALLPSALARLSIQRYTIDGLQIAGLLTVLPSLEQLEIVMDYKIIIKGKGDAVPLAYDSFPPRSLDFRLKTLRVLGSFVGDDLFFQWLYGARTIRAISIQLNPTPLFHIARFLRSLGPSLASLEMSFAKRPYQADQQYLNNISHINLAFNPSLHTLQFHHVYGPELLSTLSSSPHFPSLREISFLLTYDFTWDMINHKSLSSILSECKFWGLRRLKFIHGTGSSTTKDTYRIRRMGDRGGDLLARYQAIFGQNVRAGRAEIKKGEEDNLEPDPYTNLQELGRCQVIHVNYDAQDPDSRDCLPGVNWLWTTNRYMFMDDASDDEA